MERINSLTKDTRIEAILKIINMTEEPIQDIFNDALEEAIRITDSEIGYLAFLNSDETILTMYAWSESAMDQCKIIDKPIVYYLQNTGLWGEAVRQRKPVITNDYSLANPYKKGYPEGHVPVKRHMNIPVFDGNKIVAVVGVGNKKEEYNINDLNLLTLLMDGMWKIISRKRMEEELQKSYENLELKIQERTLELQREIEERKKTEIELRANEEKLNSITVSARDGIIMIDNDGNISFWNQGAEKIFGYSWNEVKYKNLHELLAPKRYYKTHFENFEKFKKTGKGLVVGQTLELFSVHKDGEEIPIELSLSAVKINNAWSAIGIVRDIKDRKQIEQALIEKEIRLRSILGTAHDAIISIDFDGKIIFWNHGAEVIFGYNAEEVIGKTIDILLQKDELNYDNPLGGIITSGNLVGNKLQLEGMNKKGNKFPIELSLGSWTIKSVVYFTLIIRDISERVNLEISLVNEKLHLKEIQRKLLRKQDELEKAYEELKSTQMRVLRQEKMASIGQLAAGIAHEINNPIGFISGNLRALDKYILKFTDFISAQTEIIQSCCNPEIIEDLKNKRKSLKIDYLMEDVKELIKESLEGTERVRKIVQDLKTFSRIDEVEYKEVNLHDCLNSTINIVWNELKYKANLVKDYGSISHIKCFPLQINQVFMNLLINASQAIEKSGEIKIKTWEKDNYIFVSITDNGCGIEEEKLNKIFDAFYTTKEVGQGTGLGLSITYEIIKKHKGDIMVESKVGKGTTFTVKLPLS